MEKCEVCAASPISTIGVCEPLALRRQCTHSPLTTRGKRIHCDEPRKCAAFDSNALPSRYFAICPTLCKPQSRGHLTLRPGRPAADPLIQPSYLQCEEDWQVLERGIELMRDLVRTKAIAAFGPRAPAFAVANGHRMPLPNRGVRPFIAAALTTAWHPSGTCKMGRDDLAVVDPQLRVRGVTGLRVADASIMPIAPSGNINAACIMIGEKCADMLRPASTASALDRATLEEGTDDALAQILRIVLARDDPPR